MSVHLVNGDAAAGGFRNAALADEQGLLICRDVLSCGPAPAFTDIDSWRQTREAFWVEVLASNGAGPKYFESGWRDLYLNLHRLRDAQTVTLWLGRSLSDQLLLAFTAFLLDDSDADMQLVQFEHHANGAPIRGLGELHAEQLAAHPPPVTLRDDERAAACRVWQAYTAADSRQLFAILDAPPAQPDALFAALPVLRHRFPDASRGGLSLWDWHLLESVATQGPQAPRVIAGVMAPPSGVFTPLRLDVVGDHYLIHRLKGLGDERLVEPLVTFNDATAPLAALTVELTGFGRDVLNGDAQLTDRNGIEDWVGGVRLEKP